MSARKKKSDSESIQDRESAQLVFLEETWYGNIFPETYAPEMKTAAVSHWADDYKPQARSAVSQRGSDRVIVSIENCPQHILLCVFSVPYAKSHC